VKVDELRAELAEGMIRPAYLVVGEEPLLRDDSLALIRAAVLTEGPEDFNYDRLDGASTRPAGFLDAVAALPVMAPRRLVLLREPESGRARGGELTEAIADVIPTLAEQAETVLVVVAAKADGRARWTRAFSDPAASVRCDPPKKAREIASFLRAEAKRQAVVIEPAAVELLVERVGPQLLMLRNEIAKAALLAGEGAPVARGHVAAGTSDMAEEPVWDLTDAIGEGRAGDALSILAKILRAGSAAPLILGALASHFRKLLRLRSGGRAAGPPFAVKKLRQQAGRYTPGRLVACLHAIHDTDMALKGVGVLAPERALERLVIGLAG
jgi:DNA polymerase-3 subunit delta